jgi:hypothetical protein
VAAVERTSAGRDASGGPWPGAQPPPDTPADPGFGMIAALALAWAIGMAALALIYELWVPGLVDRMIAHGVPFPKPTKLMVIYSSVIRNAWPAAIPLGVAFILGLPRRQGARVGAVLMIFETLSVLIVLSGMILAYKVLRA